MPVDLAAAIETAHHLRGYERDLLSSLVSRPSVRAEASDVHELCVRELEKLGMEVELITPRVEELEGHPEWCPPHPASAEPERLVSVLGSSGQGPGIFLFAHIDTEKPDPRGDWDTDPYRATESGRRIYGVGTADDKAGVVSVLAAARALLPRLQGVRVVVGLVHGKLGGGLGTLPMMARVGEVDASIYCHPGRNRTGNDPFQDRYPRLFQLPHRDGGETARSGGDTHPQLRRPQSGDQRLHPTARSAGRGGPVG